MGHAADWARVAGHCRKVLSLIETDISLISHPAGQAVFQFELLTKRDWSLVVAVAALMGLLIGGSLYWLAVDYTSVSLSADHGRLGRY